VLHHHRYAYLLGLSSFQVIHNSRSFIKHDTAIPAKAGIQNRQDRSPPSRERRL
jgi:hypothetical protein